MKKSIIIVISLVSVSSVTAYGFMNWNDSTKKNEVLSCNSSDVNAYYHTKVVDKLNEVEFDYNVDSRFNTTVTKQDLQKAKSIDEIIPNGTKGMSSFRNVKVTVRSKENEKFSMGNDIILNSNQLNLLKSIEYSTNFSIESSCKWENPKTGKIEDYDFVYYITVVPEKVAEFKKGNLSLIAYLKENSIEEARSAKKDQLQPGKVEFVVTTAGQVKNVVLESTSGYDSIDEKMIKLIKSLSGEWNPATNSKGEPVDQKLVFFYGMIGC